MKPSAVSGPIVLALCASLAAQALEPAPAADPAVLPVAAPLRRMALPLPPAVSEALRARRWDAALAGLQEMDPDTLVGAQKGDWAFLVAWCASHGDHPEVAVPVLPLLGGDAPDVPGAYADLVVGEVLAADGKAIEALERLARVPEGSVMYARAALRRAEALRDLGRTKEAFEVLEAVAARPDPAEGNAEALVLLAEHHGLGSDAGYPLLRRVYAGYPGSEADTAASRALAAGWPGKAPTWQDKALRAERWMEQGNTTAALSTLEGVNPDGADGSTDACRVRFVRGRSQYKKNQLTAAAQALTGIGEACVSSEEDYGPRGLYLLGTAEYRRKQFDASVKAYRALADHYPDHSMADDALTRGGISLIEAGRPDEARKWWEEALARHPQGDTVPEALLRLAFDRYLAGDADDARGIAGRLAALPPDGDAVHVQAGRYWAARWRLYPDAKAPGQRSSDPAAVADAVAGFRALCEQQPHSFYAIQAWGRLREIAPDVAAEVARRPDDHQDGTADVPWEVRVDLLRDPNLRDGVALMRLGLVQEAKAEWSRVDEPSLRPDEKAWLTELRIVADDWLLAHDDLRRWLKSHPIGTLGEREPQIVRLAYPDRYWTEVQASVKDGYRFEPRLFHALVREESNFNRQIVSFAGARGLSQLMPATARQTAGWLKMTITMDDLEDPATNLAIGARYLDAMHKQLAGSPYLALAAYNGGAGNVEKWLGQYGNPPTDELVERIPFEETRGYVKRVMGTWQTMRWWFDDGDGFYDLSRYNHHARPE